MKGDTNTTGICTVEARGDDGLYCHTHCVQFLRNGTVPESCRDTTWKTPSANVAAPSEEPTPTPKQFSADDIRLVNRTLGFLKSVILSGESWSAHCQEAYDKAGDAMDRIAAVAPQGGCQQPDNCSYASQGWCPRCEPARPARSAPRAVTAGTPDDEAPLPESPLPSDDGPTINEWLSRPREEQTLPWRPFTPDEFRAIDFDAQRFDEGCDRAMLIRLTYTIRDLLRSPGDTPEAERLRLLGGFRMVADPDVPLDQVHVYNHRGERVGTITNARAARTPDSSRSDTETKNDG